MRKMFLLLVLAVVALSAHAQVSYKVTGTRSNSTSFLPSASGAKSTPTSKQRNERVSLSTLYYNNKGVAIGPLLIVCSQEYTTNFTRGKAGYSFFHEHECCDSSSSSRTDSKRSLLLGRLTFRLGSYLEGFSN